jgi:hypothetical protein
MKRQFLKKTYFCEAKISSSMIPIEIMPNILDHGPWVANGGNHIGISNHVKMFSTITLFMKMNVRASKPGGVDEKQYFQHSEIRCQIYLPQSFMLVDIILNHLGALTSNSVPNILRKRFIIFQNQGHQIVCWGQ